MTLATLNTKLQLEPGTHHDALDTSELEHQIEVTEPNTHDATNLENQTEMTEPDMHTATDHTVNKQNSVPNCQHKILKQ